MAGLEIVDVIYRAARTRDFPAFAAVCAPGVEWVQNPGFPGGGRHVGARAIFDAVFERLFDDAGAGPWVGFGFERDATFDAGAAVIVTGRYVGTHRATGRRLEASAAHVYEIEAGRLVRYRQFADTKTIWDAMGAVPARGDEP